MHQECTDRDDLPEDLAELEELRISLSDSLVVLQKKIRRFSNELGENYMNALKSDNKRQYEKDNELIIMSNHNDRMLNEFTNLGELISRVDLKINGIKKKR